MKTVPHIIVQLIHIEGPLKGQIVELSDPVIDIGRHPSCQLRFPADFNIISRKHATITREGNRFKITDHSVNGTIVNGRRISETYLRDGDVITIAEGGPKISFLTRVDESAAAPEEAVAGGAAMSEEKLDRQAVPPAPEEKIQPPSETPPVNPEASSPNGDAGEILIVQYGPTLHSFELPVRAGRHPGNDFVLDHPGILDQHAEIYFTQGQYWVRDMTGQKLVTINSIPAGDGAPMQRNDRLALTPGGPFFQFLGEGRLSEVEEPAAGSVTGEQEMAQDQASERGALAEPASFFKKILKKI